MIQEFVPVSFNKMMQSKAYTVVVLGDESKRFAIYMEPEVGRTLLSFLTEEKRARPLSHTLFLSMLDNLEIKVLQIIIQDYKETVYFARIFLEQSHGEKRQIIEIDARPSDAILLGVMAGAPILCNKKIFDIITPFQE
jgi:bifunctional DNase/RNase